MSRQAGVRLGWLQLTGVAALAGLAAVSSSCTGGGRAAERGEVGYWSGSFSIDGRRWTVGVSLARSCENGALVDVDSIWRARLPAAELDCDDGRVAFSLPWALGRFSGARAGGAIDGRVTRGDGESAPLELEPTARPRILREELTIERDGVRIAATLALPAGAGPHPLLIVLHGGGDSSRTAEPYAFWADYLPRHGYGALLYDKRGNGASTGSWREVGFEPRAADVASLADLLVERATVDPRRIGLLAVSQGGWVAGLAARQTENISFVARISAPAVGPLEADTYALAERLRREGLVAEDVAAALELWRQEVELIRDLGSAARWAAYRESVRKAEPRPWYAATGYTALTPDHWFGRWYAQVVDHDPRELICTSLLPSLWMYGAEDTQSDIERNLEVLDVCRRRAAGKIEVRVYPDAGHGLLVPAAGGDEVHRSVTPAFFPDLLDWLARES